MDTYKILFDKALDALTRARDGMNSAQHGYALEQLNKSMHYIKETAFEVDRLKLVLDQKEAKTSKDK